MKILSLVNSSIEVTAASSAALISTGKTKPLALICIWAEVGLQEKVSMFEVKLGLQN
jgi:hypothetical protein